VYRESVSRSANRVSSETPSQDVPSLDQCVTQWISTVIVSVGNSRNDLQLQLRKTFLPSSMVSSHRSREMCGVGPADKTGKSGVRYCPGGNFASVVLRLPENPREIIDMFFTFLECAGPAALWYSVAIRAVTILKRRRAGALQRLIRQPAFLNYKFRNSIDAFTASQICKYKRTLGAHSLRI